MAGARPVSGQLPAAGWLEEVPLRRLVEAGLETTVPLPPGDRPLVEPGAVVTPGDPLLEHVRDRRVEEVDARAPEGDALLAGTRWAPAPGHRRGAHHGDGELLTPIPGKGGRWRMVTGEVRAQTIASVGGIVVEVRPGAMIRLRVEGLAIRGAFAAGASARGRLELATDPFGELRAGGIDVGRTGSILVVGSRIDAEALTRARAMGVRGIVAASVGGKDLRDFRASERRQRAALHVPEPFGVLALDGTIKRQIATPLAALLERLAGREVALLVDPPALVFDPAGIDLPDVPPDWVRVRSGPSLGAEGRVRELLGLRRFPGGVHLEAALVDLDGDGPVEVPLGDLERIA